MKKSYISILLLFLVMILAISAASAAEIDDTSDSDALAADEATVDEVVSADAVDDVQTATEEAEVLTDAGDGNNFTSLQTLIDKKGETVILDKDYVRVEGDSSLNINEDTTIVGGYHKIDAANLGGIFNVKSGVTLVLTGVTLVNGNSDYGGAIYNEGIVNIYDSTFENNTATVDGGAIYNNGTIEQLSSSTFKNNLAIHDGGAVYTNTDLTVDYNSVFNENTAKHEGGAIFAKAKSSLTVNQTTFSENKVSENNYVHGGAIATGTSCSLIVTGCIFEDNVADLTKNSQGGAIWTQASCNVTITDSSFTNNQASRKGGAIYTGSKNSLIIKDSTFTKNTAAYAGSNGGAIAMYTNGELSIEGDCEFIANSAANGGAIHLDKTDANITGAVFSGNKASKQGGAIYLSESGKTVSVKNSTFTDNTNNGEANSIYLSIGNLELSGNTIHGNESEIYVATSGKLLSEITVDILNHETVATYDGTYLVNATVTDDNGNPMTIVKGLTFVTDGAEVEAVYNATTGVYEGLMTLPAPGIYTVNITYIDEDKLNVKTATINNHRGTFQDLQDKIDNAISGTLDLPYDFAFTPELGDTATEGIVIDKDLTINGNGYTISGNNAARIFVIDVFATVNLEDIVFANGAADYGGAIYAAGILNVDNCTFINNTATVAGNAIYVPEEYMVYIIDSEESYNALLNDPASALNKYYIANPREDGIDADGNPVYDETTEIVGHSWLSAITADAVNVPDGKTKFPWILLNMNKFNGVVNIYFNGTQVFGPWDLAGRDKMYAIISVPASDDCNMVEYALEKGTGNADKKLDASLFVVKLDSDEFTTETAMDNTVSIKDSKFFDNGDDTDYAIYNLGKLALENNTISNLIYNEGELVNSIINITVMDNDTFNFSYTTVPILATITDDNGNPIFIPDIKFLVGTEEVDANYNDLLNIYYGNYVPTSEGSFVVTMNTTLPVNTALITFTRSLSDIARMIDAAEEGATIELDGDYKYVEELDSELVDGIIINKTITIDGKGYTVSGSDANRMFYIKAHNVTLTNITFANGNASGKWGGAIYVNGAYENLTISDSKFYNNTADVNGGAIYWAGDKGKLISSEFKENIAGESGGAVFWYGDDGEITGTTFEDNYAKSHGGAVVWFTYGTSGGHNGVIDNSIFNNNEAGAAGGAVSWQSDNGKIIDSTFNENKAPNAGAVYWSANDGNITGGKFSKNNATDNLGGAIFIEKGSLYIESDFYENTAKNGGAVASFATVYIDSDFSENTATSQGGAIFALNADTTVNGSYFEDNTAPFGGMSIYVNGGTLALEGNSINNVEPEIDIENGGKLTSTIKVTILDGEVKTIETLEAELSAKVTDDKDNLIKDAQFKFTINDNEVAAVYNAANKLYEATYTLPSAGIYPVNITYASDDELEVENATVKSIYGTFTQLQQLIDNATDTLVLPYNFTYNAEIDGDALKAGVVIGKHMTVDGNGSTISGADAARIFQLNKDNINIKNTTFTNGYSNTSSQEFADWGGAIYSNGAYIKHNISDCKFYNNTAYNGGAIYLAGDYSVVTGCEFEDNNANASGGAVFIVGWSDTIDDSTFKLNMANELGGAVACYSTKQGAEITDSVFIGNTAFANGGAVSMQRAAGKITDSNFTGNAASNGGAVYWSSNGGSITGGEFIENEAVDNLGGAIFAEGTGLTITSTFTENSAENGGAIAVFKDATITESTFTNNTADNYGGAIYVNGSAKLDITKSVMKNNSATVGSSIYSNGTIGSTIVNATILDNKTWNDTGLGDIYVLNATLTDDMGNNIYDPNFRFTVNGTEIADEPLYDDETGLYTLGYVVEKAGLNVISTSYNAANLQVFTGALDIPLANVTEFTVFAFDNLEGENTTVFVTLIGVNDVGLDSIVTVIVNNKEYAVVVKNGTGNITIENLTHGQYPVVAMFEDPNYESAINSTVFYVKGQAVLNITELTTAVYGDEIEITINLTDSEGNPLSGVVTIDDVIKVLVEEGIGTFVIDNQPDVGNYTFIAVYSGDEDYFGDLALFNVTVITKVINPEDILVEVDDTEFGDNITVTVYSPVDGTYTVNVNGTSAVVEVVNGIGSVEIPALDKAGTYNATVDIDDDNYSLETVTSDDFKYMSTPDFNVTITGTYPDAVITIEGTDGNYSVYIDEDHQYEITVKDGAGSQNVSEIFAGDHVAEVTFYEQNGYYEDYQDVDFTIDRASFTEFAVFAFDTLEGENATVFVTLIGVNGTDLDSIVTVIVDNKEYDVLVINGTGNITIEDLAHGQYTVVAMFDDYNYEPAINSTVFNVKGQAVLNITELTTAEYGDEIEITINLTDSEGNPLSGVVTIDDVIKVLVEEGIGTFVIDNQPDVGNYTFMAVYGSDEDYFGDLVIFNVTVTAKELDQDEVEFSFEGDYDNGLNITITSPVDGNYTVDINGTNVTVEVVDGTGSAIAKLDKPDDYTAVITLDDENYSLEPIEYDVVYKGAPVFTVEINGTYPNAEIRIFGTPGTYHVDIDGFDTINITVGEYGLPGVAPIEGIAAGNYTAIVSYDTNDEYRGDYKEVNFTVAKAPLTIDEPAIIGDKVIGSQINITFTLPTDVDPSNVSAYMDGIPVPTDDFIINETTGVYTLVLDGFPAAEGHNFVVQVNDPNYEEGLAQVSFLIEKITPTLDVSDAAGEWNQPIDIPIKLTAADGTPITGDVIVTVSWDVDGKTQVVTLNETGEDVATFAITEALGNLTVTAKYYGNDIYYGVEKTATLTITEPMEAKLVVVADSQVPYDETVYVNVTLTNVRDVAIENATITYSVDGGEAQTAKVDEYGLVSIPVTGLAGGEHTITVTFYNESYRGMPVESVTVTVTPIAPVFTSNVTENAKVGENVTITITAPGLTGNFTVTVDSEPVTFDLPVIDGVAIINVTGLAAGHHSYEVTYNGDENYTVASDANSFDVVQVPTETALNVTIPENTTTPVFSVNLPEDATGYLLVDVDGQQYYAPLVNGSASIETAPLAGGNHTVKVTYTGDDKYAGFSNTTNMTIDSNVTADTALDVPASSENTPTFSVNLPSDATGFLTVDVDGKKYAAVVENGKASISVPGLSEGNHNVTVIYSGDAKYPTLTKDATVNVHIPVYKITQNKNINVVYSAKATYKVLITKDGKAVGAGESVTIKYNGKTYTVKTDSKGYATFKPTTKVKVKKYTITATYKGVTVKNTVKVKHLIKAKNKKIKKSKKVNKIKVKTNKVNGKYLKGKKLTLKIKGKKVKAKINKKGVATFKLKKKVTKKLKAGKKYKYTVTYGKDKVTKKVKVKK